MKFLIIFIFVALANAHRKDSRLSKHLNETEIISYIIGGRQATDGDAPWQVSIQVKENSYHICGGSIISESWIVSSASCLYLYYSQESALFIKYNTLTLSGGQMIDVANVIPHEQFQYSSHDYDIALVKTITNMTLGQMNAKKINLPDRDSRPMAGSMINITGWGYTTKSFPDNLMILEYPVATDSQCRVRLSPIMTERMFCAGGKGECATEGDYGGPGAANEQLVGVILGNTGCTEESYDVFTNVGSFVTWIEETMNNQFY